MKLTDNPNIQRPLIGSTATIQYACWIITALVILPNLFFFSVDDANIISYVDPLKQLAIDQTKSGRYASSALCLILKLLGGTRIDLEIVGVLTMITGFPALFRATIRMAGAAIEPIDFVLGFSVFVTFGLLMDEFSFTNVLVPFGATSLALAASLNIALSSMSHARKVAAISCISWLAMGFYQVFPYMVACSLIGAYVGSFGFGYPSTGAKIRDRYVPVVFGAFIGIGMYFLTTKTLHVLGVPGFRVVERPFGLEYIRPNLAPYFETIRETLNPISGRYANFLSKFSIAAAIVGIGSILWRSRRLQEGWLIIAIATMIMMLPNPTNLLMQDYWPSPRTLSPIAIFVAIVLVAAASKWKMPIGGVTIGRWVLVCAIVAQGVVYLDQQKMRFDQQMLDFAMANAIINRAFEEFSINETPKVKIGFDWQDNRTLRYRAFEFGASAFSATWGYRGLIRYLSDRKIDIEVASPEDCSGVTKRLDMKRVGDALVVCSAKQ